MKNQKVIIRFDEVSTRDKYGLRRIEGTATAGSMIRLIDIADLTANPREAKCGDVTDGIEESLEKTPQWFPFKSKGILSSAASCVSLDRNRFELAFTDEDIEGILDGGHNLLAIALHILGKALGDDAEKTLRGVKRWEQIPDIWKANRDKVEAVKGEFTFLTPMEVIYPHDTAAGRDEFQNAVLDVAQARNNNAQLTDETRANKSGFYEPIKASMDQKLVDQVEWKTNDGGRIKARDLVALTWIAISRIPGILPDGAEFNPVHIYSSKGMCVSAYNDLMRSDAITKQVKGDIRELVHDGVKSAIALMRDIPRLFDLVYSDFPEAYLAASSGFGRINSVRIYESGKTGSKDPKYLSRPPRTKFYQTECKYDYPEGFIMPIMWGLRELMEFVDGKVQWTTKISPEKFLKDNLKGTLMVYFGFIQMGDYDPQRIGKTAASYTLIANDFKSRLKDSI
jgi:hypothetical protein